MVTALVYTCTRLIAHLRSYEDSTLAADAI